MMLLPRPWWEDSRVSMDRMRGETFGKSRGFGFVIMGSAAEAEKLIGELNGQEIDGRVLTVKTADDR
jgi:RNA recognition motif-containing protein